MGGLVFVVITKISRGILKKLQQPFQGHRKEMGAPEGTRKTTQQA
jgi:hypothetical protein